MRANIIRQLGDTDYHLVEDLDRGGPAIMDCEGERVMRLPPAILTILADDACDAILLELVIERAGAIAAAWEQGERAGVDHTVAFTRRLLGTDAISNELELVRNDLFNISENLHRVIHR